MISYKALHSLIVTAFLSFTPILFVAAAASWTCHSQPPASAVQSKGVAPAKKGQKKPTRTDRYGDPLPPDAIARLGSIRFRHNDGVNVVSYSSNGKKLVSACSDGSFHIWNTKGQKLHSISSQPWGLDVPALAISPDGKTGICADGRGLRVWDLSTGKHRPLPGSKESAFSVAFSPNGKRLAAAQHDAVTVWDMTTGTRLHRIERKDMHGWFVVFSPDNRYLAWVATAPNAPQSPVLLRTIFHYDLKQRKELRQLNGHRECVSSLVFSADGKTLFSASVDDTIRAWDISNGKERWRLKGNGGKRDDFFGNTGIDSLNGGVTTLAISGDGTQLAGGNFNGSIQVWDIATRKQLFRLRGHGQKVSSLSFSPDGQSLASAGWDESVRVWDLSSGKERFPATGHAGYVIGVTVSPDGKRMASTGFGGFLQSAMHFWETKTFKKTAVWRLPKAGLFRADFSPDGLLLAAGNWDNTVRVWNVATGKAIWHMDTEREDWTTGSDVAFSPDGTMFATYRERLPRGYCISLWNAATKKRLRTVKDDQRTKAYLGTLRFSPDGKMFAVHLDDKTVTLFNTTTGKVMRRFPGGMRYDFAGDSKTLLIISTKDTLSGTVRETVHVWDVINGTKRYSFSLPAEPVEKRDILSLLDESDDYGDVRWQLPLTSDGKMLATPVKDHTVALIEVATGQVRRHLAGHQRKIVSLAFFPDGKRLVSSSYDTTCLVWDVTRLRPNQSQTDVSTWWKQLAGRDAAKAYDAILALIARPRVTVPFLRKKLHPIAPLSEHKIKKLIAALDSRNFRTRTRASRQIAQLDLLAEPHLKKARSGKNYPLEVHLRVQKLLEDLHKPVTSPAQLLHVRSVEVLEHIGTAEARKLLSRLADGASAARLTREARAALGRLSKAAKDKN